jgi:hypothetical protein
MTSKDLLIAIITESVDNLFRNARAVPADKLEWSPEGARSVLDQVQECAQAPRWSTHMLRERGMPKDLGPDSYAKAMEERKSWTTLDACEAECKIRVNELLAEIRSFPEEEMTSTMFLPFTGKDHPFWDIMLYPYWNNTWHCGQIAYIQSMLGDKEMH